MKIFHVIWGQLIVAAATFASIRVYTELMDAQAFGAAMLGLGVLAFIEGLVTMALNQTQVALCAKTDVLDSRQKIAVGLAYLMIAAIGCILLPTAVVLGAAAIPFAPLLYAAAACVALFFYLAAESAKFSLQALLVLGQQYRRLSLWNAGETLLAFATITAVLIDNPDPWHFLAAHVAARIASDIAFLLVFGGPKHFRGVGLGAARPLWREALRYGLAVSAMAPLGWISSFLDRFIIAAMLGPAATGTYVAATGLVGRPYALTTAILSSYFRPPLFTASQGDGEARAAITGRWLAAAAIIGLGGALALLVLGPYLLPLMIAADYRSGAVPLMVCFALAQTLAIMTHALDNTLLAAGRSAALLKTQSMVSVSTLAIIPVGTLLLGPLGATLARCVAETFKLGATAALVRKIRLKPAAAVPVSSSSLERAG